MNKFNKFLKITFIAIISGTLLLAGCDREDEESAPSEIVVSGGDISEPEKLPFPVTACGVRLEKAVERAVSLSPAATEIICELGFQGTLVGVSGYCDYPELSVQRVGSTENPDINAIIQLRPDAVFTLSALSEREAYSLEQAGIAVLTAGVPTNMEGYTALYRDIASAFYGRELTESQKEVSKALQAGKDARSALERAAQSVEPYTFIYVTEKMTVAGTDTFESAVLGLAGENRYTGSGYTATENISVVAPVFIIADSGLSEEDIDNDEVLSDLIYNGGSELRFVDSRCFERPTARTAEVFASLTASAPEPSYTTEETGETADEYGTTDEEYWW
ncbi:MAG: ABC transporter substrate-binding protein [Ruminococcaceae bacterium]|nr:ABC transporter substrate-binding protein [Oscillospiraceae bacterium]